MSVNWVSTFAGFCPKTQDDKLIVPSFLTPDIALGQFGSVDSHGVFTPRGTIDTMPAHDAPVALGDIFSFKGGATFSTKLGVSLGGEAIDPDTGTKVKVGTEMAWTFTESTSLGAQLASAYHDSIDPEQALQENQEQITLVAKQYGYTTKAGELKSDWVVITDVFSVISGIIVGSNDKSSTYSITGAASAINNLIGGEVNAGWSFEQSSDTQQLFTVRFPGQPVALNSDGSGIDPSTVGTSDKLYTVAFSAASIQGTHIEPWSR